MCLDHNTCELDMTPHIPSIIVGRVVKKRLLFAIELYGVLNICGSSGLSGGTKIAWVLPDNSEYYCPLPFSQECVLCMKS